MDKDVKYIHTYIFIHIALPWWLSGKKSACKKKKKKICLQCMRHTFAPWVRKILEKEMATHPSILAWEIPWTEEPGRLQSMGLERVGHG